MEVSVPHNLEELKRNKLQALCKTFKIPANLKNVELIKKLKEIREQQLCNQVVSNDHDPQCDNTTIVSSTITGTSVHDEGLSKDDQMCHGDNVVDDALLHHDDDGVAMVTTNDEDNDNTTTKKRATGSRRKRKVGHSKKQRRGRRARVTDSNDDVVMDDHCVIDDHVMGQCPEGVNTGSHSDNLAINTPAAVFTPAKEIINEDSVISSSARRRRKCWSEVQHNESIEELFDRMAAETTAKTKPSVAGGNDRGKSEVTQSTVSGMDDMQQEHIQDDEQPPKKRRRRSTFDVESSSTLSNITDDDNSSSSSAPTPSSNRGSLSNQFMKQKKQKPVAIGNSSLLTEQSLSPLVTNSQSAPSGGVADEDKVKEEVTALLEDRVKLRKSQGTLAEANAKERGGATSIAGQKRKQEYSATTNNSKIPVAKLGKKAMTSKDFDRIHQKNFNRSQSILEYNDRKQKRILSSVTPLNNSSSVNKRNNITGVKCTTTGYKFKQTEPRLNHTASSVGVFNFTATSTTKQVNKRHKETAERRKSYNARNSAKKKPRNYTPYTGKLPPLQPIRNF